MENMNKMLPKGLKKKVEAGLDMVQATLDCNRGRVDFSAAVCDRLNQNCYCHDVGLIINPPALDTKRELLKLNLRAEKYLRRDPDRAEPTSRCLQTAYKSARAQFTSRVVWRTIQKHSCRLTPW